MFHLRQIRTFSIAAETLSFTATARQVHLSQSSVTEQIQSLEEFLGQRLFDRRNNRLELTAAGSSFAVRARELLSMAESAVKEARGDRIHLQASIRVAAPQTLCGTLLHPLRMLADQSPAPLQVDIQERNSAEVLQAVIDGSAEVGLVHGWPRSDAVAARVLARDPPIVAMPIGHELASKNEVTIDDLAQHPLVVTPEGCRYREYLKEMMQTSGRAWGVHAQAESVPTLLGLIGVGIGVAVLPRRSIESRWHDRCEFRPLAPASHTIPICVLTPADTSVSPAVAEFIQRLEGLDWESDQPMATFDLKDRAGDIPVGQQE